MLTQDQVRSVAAVFTRFGEANQANALRDIDPPGSIASRYFQLLQGLDGADVPAAVHDTGFFRFFVTNGLLQAQRLRDDLRAFVLRAIGAGLHDLARYFAYLTARSAAYPELELDEKRYFAFAIAQLIEIGFEMDGLLMTMKGDAADQANAYELRRLREDGPDAFADSFLFTDDEKVLWNAVFEGGGLVAIHALQHHFVTTYGVPFIAAPSAAET